MNLCFRSDIKYVEFSDPSINEHRGAIDNLVRDHYERIKNLFDFVQSQSLNYPNLTADSLYQIVFRNLRSLNMGYAYSKVDFEKLLIEGD